MKQDQKCGSYLKYPWTEKYEVNISDESDDIVKLITVNNNDLVRLMECVRTGIRNLKN